ncbi:unnamed protein product, partial [Mesorhabditis belari]|uniref:Globin family profile domain-containing protein n=1 Tax=Mesorhabditis belari TaxID=2138241 RepID=A0AAF3FRN8_9BILA
MRIKEAILRKKIIQQLNEEWKDYEDEIAALLRQETNANHPNELLNLLRVAKSMQLKQQKISTASFSPRTPRTPHSPTKSSSKFPFSPELSTLKESKRWQRRRRRVFDERENDPLDEQSGLGDEHKKSLTRKESQDGPKQHPLQAFVDELQTKLTVLQKRALKVTWKRLSEAPKTSGRGTIHIMEKIFEKMVELEPKVPSLFYKSAFISCCHDRKDGRAVGDTISTTRDHAHILVQYIDTMLQLMFEGKADRQMPSPEEIGAYHVRLYPLGLQRHMWQVMGESMAEVMFVQECVRAYPHAASAWSLLSVAFTDKIYGACKPPKDPSEISITCKPIIEREDSPSSDSGCPYSNKSSMRDDHSGSEGTSGVESVSPHKEPPNSIGNRFGKLRPPGLLHPMNLSQEAIYEPPIDYT